MSTPSKPQPDRLHDAIANGGIVPPHYLDHDGSVLPHCRELLAAWRKKHRPARASAADMDRFASQRYDKRIF